MASASFSSPFCVSASLCYSRSEPPRFVRSPSNSGPLTAVQPHSARFSRSSSMNSSKPSDNGGSVSPLRVSSSLCYSRFEPPRFVRFPSNSGTLTAVQPHSARFSRSSSLNCSKSSENGGSVSPGDEELDYELQHGLPPRPQPRKGASVFVKLPQFAVIVIEMSEGLKELKRSMIALADVGVEGVVMAVHWGFVETYVPGKYDWRGYLDIVSLARDCKLKVRAVLEFHQLSNEPYAPPWIPLPKWVDNEMEKNVNMSYCDWHAYESGTPRNNEYISLGCDVLPVLRGRSPIQTYSDFMRSFKDAFKEFIGIVIMDIQVGMGPEGELRYPSKIIGTQNWHLGEFYCYDEYMLASLKACVENDANQIWGARGPPGGVSPSDITSLTPKFAIDFFSTPKRWATGQAHFFLEWYSRMLILHGERLCIAAKTIFQGTGVNVSAKVAVKFRHYHTDSHPCELTAGYYNNLINGGYLPLIQMFGKHGITMCFSCFDIIDEHSKGSAEGLVKQLVLTAKACGVPIIGENYYSWLTDKSVKNVLEMMMLYSEDLPESSISFNFKGMEESFREHKNWVRLCDFVSQMSGLR